MTVVNIRQPIQPARVIINEHGEATTPARAAQQGIFADVVFLRDDGWSLGAPAEHETLAYETWRESWTHFCRVGVTHKWQPISEYPA